MELKRLLRVLIAVVLLVLGLMAPWGSIAESMGISPLTGEHGQLETDPPLPQGALPADAGGQAPCAVDGGLYGTDGANLYLIDKATGNSTLIGSHGTVEIGIGALAFDSRGMLYGMSLGPTARLYTIDPTSGTATPVGTLGLGNVFEGGLAFGPSGVLFGANTGSALEAQAFTVNTMSGAGSVLGPDPGAVRDLNGLACDAMTCYAIDRMSDTVGTMSASTGVYTALGNPGFTVGNNSGLALCEDGTLYATNAGGLYTVDKATGVATSVGASAADWGMACAPLLELDHVLYLPIVIAE